VKPFLFFRRRSYLCAGLAILTAAQPLIAQSPTLAANSQDNASGRPFLTALRAMDLSPDQRREILAILRGFRQESAGSQNYAKLRSDIEAVLTPGQRDDLMRRLDSGSAPTTDSTPPLTCTGTDAEKAQYKLAGDYSARHAGMSVLVIKDGAVVYERYEGSYGPDQSHLLASGTKSFWGILAACAVKDGLFSSLDERASDTLTEWKGDPRRSKITVRHLLSFTSGLASADHLFSRPDVKDRYAFAVAQPATAEPGAVYHYDDVHLYAFGALLSRKLSARAKQEGKPAEDILAYLTRRVLDPIGLHYARWARDAAGNPALPYGAVLSSREWAKLGELVLNEGRWQGKEIVPPKLLKECLTPGSKANPAYGLTWWLNHPAPASGDGVSAADGGGRHFGGGDVDKISAQGIYLPAGPDLVAAAGAGQQRLYVLPSRHLVIVRQANPDTAEAMMGRGRMDHTFSDATFLGILLDGKAAG
jgi:CubicO group peptidase (beta-lactamase class C family)